MKKKSLMLLFSIPFALALAGLAACEEECTHTYADTLSSDSEYHWYAATCEHTDMKGEAEPHKDANDDGVCDVCGYDADHTHTYDETWTSNETKHWYAAKCTHSIKKDEADHVDANNDGVCDVCGWSADATHQHTFKAVWSTDATYHWYDAKCEHDVEVKIEHVDEDENNTCDVCGYVSYDLSEVIASATSAASKAKVNSTVLNYSNPYDKEYVISGDEEESYVRDHVYTFTYGADNYAKQEHVVSYEYVDFDYSTYTPIYETIETSKKNTYYSMIDEDTIFALEEDFGEDLASTDDDTLERNLYADVAEMNGSEFTANLLDSSEYGVEAILAALYNEAKTSSLVFNYSNGEAEEDDMTYYWINFLYIDRSGYGYDYSIAFSLEEGAINRFYMYIGEYEEADLVANYDDETGEMVYLFKEGATPFQGISYEVTQTLGERTAVVPVEYDKDSYLLDSFTLSDGENEYADGDTINIKVAEKLELSLADDVADKAAYNNIEFSSDLPGYSFDGVWTMGTYNNKVAGTYTLTATTDLASVTVTVVISWQDLTSLDVQVYDETYYDYDYQNEITVYQNATVDFKAVANTGANSAYVATVTAPTGVDATGYTLTLISPEYNFTATAVGTYTITCTSTVNDQITATLTVTVEKTPSMADILVGTYAIQSWGQTQGEITFELAQGSTTSGTAMLTWQGNAQTVSFVYDENTRKVNLTHVSGVNNGITSITVTSSYKLQIEVAPYPMWPDYIETYDLVMKVDNSAKVVGLWSGDLNGATYYVLFNDDGTGALMNATTYPSATLAMTFEWAVESGSGYDLIWISNAEEAKGSAPFSLDTANPSASEDGFTTISFWYVVNANPDSFTISPAIA